jgi:hypothetical protein
MSNSSATAAINSRSKLGPLAGLGLSTSATMLTPPKPYAESLTHQPTREPLNFRDLVSAAAKAPSDSPERLSRLRVLSPNRGLIRFHGQKNGPSVESDNPRCAEGQS